MAEIERYLILTFMGSGCLDYDWPMLTIAGQWYPKANSNQSPLTQSPQTISIEILKPFSLVLSPQFHDA